MLAIAIIIIILSQIDIIYAAKWPPLATTTPYYRPRSGRAKATTDGLMTTDHATGSPTIGTVGLPSPAIPQPPAETSQSVTNDIITTDAVTTPNEELNVTGTTGSPTTIPPIEINTTNITPSLDNTTNATSDEGVNITSTTGAPTISTTATPIEIKSTTSDEDVNITNTTRSPLVSTTVTPSEANGTDDPNITATTVISETTVTPEEINSTVTDGTITDEFVNNTDTSNSDEVTEITTLSDTTSESQVSTTLLNQPNPPLLRGITFTGLIIASTIVGATLLIICVIASITIVVKIRRQKVHDRRERREEGDSTDFVAVYNYVPRRSEFDITRNAAYRTGQQQARAPYSSRPNIHGGAVLTRTNRPKPMLPPRRYTRLNDQRMEVSIDSQGYVRVPRPFV